MAPNIVITASAQVIARSRLFLRDRGLLVAEDAAQAAVEQLLPEFGSWLRISMNFLPPANVETGDVARD